MLYYEYKNQYIMIMKIKKYWRKFEDWFDLNLGWFFTNGRNAEYREKMLREKFNSRGEH